MQREVQFVVQFVIHETPISGDAGSYATNADTDHGTTATLTAATDFQHHKHAKNKASGTLDEQSTVTYSEMMEHSFYQMLNLVHKIVN